MYKYTKCFLSVMILATFAGLSHAGGRTSLDMDSCFCEKLPDFQNKLNYRMFVEGPQLKQIITYVRNHVEGLSGKISTEIPSQIEVPDRQVSGISKWTSSKRDNHYWSIFYQSTFRDTVGSFAVEEVFGSGSYSYPIEEQVEPSAGTFERTKRLDFVMEMKVPSYYAYAQGNMPYEFDESANFIQKIDFSVLITQFRRYNASGYDIQFEIDPKFFKTMDKRKGKRLGEFKYYNDFYFDMMDDTFYQTLKRNGGKFSMSEYYANYNDVRICNNVLIFFSKVLKMITRYEINPYTGSRSEGCHRDSGMKAEINKKTQSIGSMNPRSYSKEKTTVDSFSNSTKISMVEIMLESMDGMNTEINELERIKPDTFDVY